MTMACLCVTMVVLVSGLARGRGFPEPGLGQGPAGGPPAIVGKLAPPPPAPRYMAKAELADLIGPREIEKAEAGLFEVYDSMGQPFFVRTTLDPELQAQALKMVRGSGALRAALVAIDPGTGRVLALAGAGNPEGNVALEGSFPAASVFKIVTAAAAMEMADFNAMTPVAYDGSKHTLYKANLGKGPDQGLHRSTLRDSFAESVNSVFGKLGAFSLGAGGLEAMALNFGFNESLAFELPLAESMFDLGEDPEDGFRLAELASGFNRETRLSPVHGALIASVALNGGDLYEPTVVSQVLDMNGDVVYRGRPKLLGKAVSLQTSEELSVLMQAAMVNGTGRKRFGDAERNPVLSKLIMGGKSGTINDENGDRVDWFVAFATPSAGAPDADDFSGGPDSAPQGSLALAAVVVHDGRTNVVSQELVRGALMAYYGPRLNPKGGTKAMAGQKPKQTRGRS
jgi:membrane peptidoglycan carboxypeptidase